MNVRDRIVLVTGASGNLGSAVVRTLLDAGARVVAIDRDLGALSSLFPAAIDAGSVAVAAGNVLDEASLRAAVAGAVERFGGQLDGVVATVGAWKGGSPVASAPWEDWEQMLALNLRSAVVTARVALERMRDGGSIVTIGSLAALGGAQGEAGYGAAKAGVLRLTEALALELRDRGIRANAILPGTLDTPQNRSWMSDEQRARAVGCEAIAELAQFLLSDSARAVTGTAVRATGRQ
jgi:NAD(P)-dependent dehydrogenase (short-subunit alcohol dehydrogenase family)